MPEPAERRGILKRIAAVLRRTADWLEAVGDDDVATAGPPAHWRRLVEKRAPHLLQPAREPARHGFGGSIPPSQEWREPGAVGPAPSATDQPAPPRHERAGDAEAPPPRQPPAAAGGPKFRPPLKLRAEPEPHIAAAQADTPEQRRLRPVISLVAGPAGLEAPAPAMASVQPGVAPQPRPPFHAEFAKRPAARRPDAERSARMPATGQLAVPEPPTWPSLPTLPGLDLVTTLAHAGGKNPPAPTAGIPIEDRWPSLPVLAPGPVRDRTPARRLAFLDREQMS